MLLDAKLLFDDTLDALHRNGENGAPDLAALTDGLRAEREQGITIDVAYRYFTTPRRSFIIADTPGHQRYTRNMVTGASTAHLAVILIDARNGIVEQSRRHATLSSLLGIRHLVAAVNKMDLVDWSEDRFREIEGEFARARRAARRRGRAGVPDLRAPRRQRGRAGRRRLVRRPAAAGAPRGDRCRDAPRLGPVPAARAVGDPPGGRRAARAPLRGPGRGRDGAGRRRDRGHAVGLAHDRARGRDARRAARVGLPARLGLGPARARPGRRARRDPLRRGRPAGRGALPRGDRLLDVGEPAARRRAPLAQAHDAHRARRGGVDRRPVRRHDAARRDAARPDRAQ